MKLELKYIVGYLPYGLKVKILNHKCDFVGIEYSEVNGYYYIGDKLHLTYKSGSTGKYQKEYKPILRPLSDLTKEIEVNGEKFVPIKILHWMAGGKEPTTVYHETISYSDVQKLYEWHFDIHGLIEKGLAIDLNTLK